MNTALRWWLPVAVAGTILCGLVYIVVLQSFRISSTNAQVEAAVNVVSEILRGTSVRSFDGNSRTDLHAETAPFTIVYNEAGGPSASTVQLDGRVPVPPTGAFSSADSSGEHRFIWQPDTTIRIAAVLLKFDGGGRKGYVLSGRSSRESDRRERSLQYQVILSWIGMLACTYLTSYAVSHPRSWFSKKNRR